MYKFNVHSPVSLEEALELKATFGANIHPLAGGTDVLVSIRNNRVDWGEQPSLLDLNKIQALHFVRETPDTIEIGPLMTHSEISNHPLIQSHIPALAKAVSYIGSPQIRNTGTIAGNMCHASPAADSLPILYCRNAIIEIQTQDQTTTVPIEEFITGPGFIGLDSSGIVTKISVPKLPNFVGDYLTLRQRQALSCNVVSVGVEMLQPNKGNEIEEIRIALGAVSPTVVRGKKTENLLKNKILTQKLIDEAHDLIQTECVPIDDVRSNKNYRQAMTGVLLSRFLINNV
ncbi:MAG: xanthine dehydrogenase family protein subunit M [Candidatus Heimdallarchaeota archaeon]|nr:MAG: xanthine dehydrogenase family protein subunit M [Candidatus Heimdallarchaeota archaeon]